MEMFYAELTDYSDRRDVPWEKNICGLELKGEGPPPVSVISKDGSVVAFGTQENKIEVWDTKSKKILCLFKSHSGYIASLSISHDNKFLLSGGYDRFIHLFDLFEKKKLKKFKLASYVNCVDISFNNSLIAASCTGGEVRTWTMQDYTPELVVNSGSPIILMKFIDVHNNLLTISKPNHVDVWSSKTLALKSRIQTAKIRIVTVHLYQKLKKLIVGYYDGRFRIYKLNVFE
jgi:WD40 repeat protein